MFLVSVFFGLPFLIIPNLKTAGQTATNHPVIN